MRDLPRVREPGLTAGRKKPYGSRYWMAIDPVGELVCLTVYKKGAMEVVRRLGA